MLTEEDYVDISALRRRGFTISEIARRTDHAARPSAPIWPATDNPGSEFRPGRTRSRRSSRM